jgi:hypothetical protein
MLITANRAVSPTVFYAPNTGPYVRIPLVAWMYTLMYSYHPADAQTFIWVDPSTRELYKILAKKIKNKKT